ncbi:MAG: hypothetical protein Q9209_002633 [Squamulea sp. 1 TL-2023]
MARDEVQEFFRTYDQFSDQPYFIQGDPVVQFMDKNAKAIRTLKMQLCMTSWDTLYYRLRANFDGLRSHYVTVRECEPDLAVGNTSYEYGCKVTNVKYADGIVLVDFERLTGKVEKLHADLVIAADGPASSIRRILCPEIERTYVGYVAWRGTVVEDQVSKETREVFRKCVSYFTYPGGHILIYLIPGHHGSLKPSQRLLNYVWYCNYAVDTPELDHLMTDIDGRRHRVTMPMGKMRPDVYNRQKLLAEQILPAAFAEVVRMTAQPFVQCITDASAPKAVFFDHQPSCLHALLLRRVLPSHTVRPTEKDSHPQVASKTTRLTFQAYESKVVQYARLTSLASVAWGNKNQFSAWVFLGSLFRLALAYVEYWIGKMWDLAKVSLKL